MSDQSVARGGGVGLNEGAVGGTDSGAGPVLVWGAGAIGGTLGAAFVRAGHAVTFVDTDADHVAAINARGLELRGPLIADTVRAPAATPATLRGTYDRAFMCVKAHHTLTATTALARHLAPDGFVVSAQNGLNEAVIADVVGPQRVIGCFVNFGADYLEPGVVHYSGRGAVVVGEVDGRRTERVATLHALMQEFSPDAVLTENIAGYLWGKLVYGALLFATALTDDAIADVLDEAAHRDVLVRLGREVGAVATAVGVRLEPFDGFDPGAFLPDATATRTDRSFADMVAHNRRSLKSHSGIWRDLAVRKRKTEADAQLGPVIAQGAIRHVPTPLTGRLLALIHAIEEGRRPLARFNLAELGARTAA